ncbi:hypothetical protein AUP68_03950 [Ilyonectria robusta]
MSFMLSSRDTTTPPPYLGSTQHATRLRNPIIEATSRRDTQGNAMTRASSAVILLPAKPKANPLPIPPPLL